MASSSRDWTAVPLDLAAVIGALAKVGVKPAAERALRSTSVLRLLKRFNLDPKHPPRDFESLYAIAVVEACWGAPEPIIRFFGHKNFREGCQKSFDTGDAAYLQRAADELFQWNSETHELGWIDYDPRQDLNHFLITFDSMIDRARNAVEVRDERRTRAQYESIDQSLKDLIERTIGLEDTVRLQRETIDDLGTHTPAHASLLSDIHQWMLAVGHHFEDFEETVDDRTYWIARVATRRGRYDRILVAVVEGETQHQHVTAVGKRVRELSLTEGWVVSERRVSAGARACVAETTNVECYTFDELIDLDADFEPYLEWLDNELLHRGVSERYIDMACTKDEYDPNGDLVSRSLYDGKNGWMDAYIDMWLDDSAKEHLSILGEFGMGKSWFCLHYAKRLSNAYRESKLRGLRRSRVPLVVPLRDYSKAVNVESLFSEFFFRKHELPLPGYRAFEQLNKMGRLLLIFDGFDEMAARVDRQSMVNNFWELARTVVPNAKVILTCRTEHFPEAREGRDLLSAKLKASTAGLSGESPQFEVLDLVPWTDEQVRTALGKLTDSSTIEVVMSNEELLELMRRPVMSDMVLDALPDIASGAPIDLARIYLYAVKRKMSRDILDERTFTSMADKVFFLSEVSWVMLTSEQMSLNYRDFPDQLRACFGAAVESSRDLDHWHHDMASQTMLIRNAQGDYYPAHRSLIEFFVALKLVAELGMMEEDFLQLVNDGSAAPESVQLPWLEYFTQHDPEWRAGHRVAQFMPSSFRALIDTFGLQPLVGPIPGMLQSMLKMGCLPALIELLQLTRSENDDTKFLGTNAIRLALQVDPGCMRGVDLSRVRIPKAALDLVNVETDFTGTRLDDADCTGADFENVILTEASLQRCNLSRSRYLGFYKSGFGQVDMNVQETFLLAASQTTLWRWNLDAQEPTALPGVGSMEITDIEISPCGRYAILEELPNSVTIFDCRTNAPVWTYSETSGCVFITDPTGATVGVALRPSLYSKTMRYVPFSDSTTAAAATSEIKLPFVPQLGRYSLSAGASIVVNHHENEFQWAHLGLIDGKLSTLATGTEPMPNVDDDLVGVGVSPATIWLRYVLGGRSIISVREPSGGSLFTDGYALGTGDFVVPAHFPISSIEATPDRVLFCTSEGVECWAKDGKSVVKSWTFESIGAEQLRIAGDRVSMVTRQGDIFVLRLTTGKLLMHHNVTSNMDGADLRDAVGLTPAMSQALARQGARVL